MRGWSRRGGGKVNYLQAPDEWRATTMQACGLWPFAAGTGSPMVGVPLGRNLLSGSSVCCDPISWFQRANLISAPTEFVLGLPGLGKSSLVRHQLTGLAGYGVIPLVLGDLKPDYVDMVRALGGQVISLGRGRGHLNVLDPGQAHEAAQRLTGTLREEVLADARGRRAASVAGLITIMRSVPPTDREESITGRALAVLDDRHHGVPVLADLLQVIRDAPDDVRQVAIDRGSLDRYKEITEGLEATLVGMLAGNGRLGGIFTEQTTEPMRRDRPVVFDLSSIPDSEDDLQAAALLACWSYGFGTVNVAQVLAEAGLEPRRHYAVALDELWRPLRAGRGMVDRIDALQRVVRSRGVGTIYITHTMSDLDLPDPADAAKARGLVERSGVKILGGLPAKEMPQLRTAVAVARAEEDMLVSWTDPPAWDPATGEEAEPPGRGKFLIKVGNRPGIPLRVNLTPVELELNDTNKVWRERSRIGATAVQP